MLTVWHTAEYTTKKTFFDNKGMNWGKKWPGCTIKYKMSLLFTLDESKIEVDDRVLKLQEGSSAFEVSRLLKNIKYHWQYLPPPCVVSRYDI